MDQPTRVTVQMKTRDYYLGRFTPDEHGNVTLTMGEIAQMQVELLCDIRDLAMTSMVNSQLAAQATAGHAIGRTEAGLYVPGS
jgi:hypothetical protein